MMSWFKRSGVVAVVPLDGAIVSGGRAGRAFDDAAVAPTLAEAFACRNLLGVALAINCPGGSPAQSSMIGARIRRLADENDVPVTAFCADVAASGGYWLACAADEIYADRASIVGSIGVIAAGFGFHEAIARLGVERRVHTAGGSKSMWDPFKPEAPEDVARLTGLQESIHSEFIEWVRLRRGKRLSDDPRLFTGEVWVGDAAREVGLIDGIGHLVPTLRARHGDGVRFKVFGRRRSLAERLGAPGVEAVADALTVRSHYARFGL